MLKRLLADGGAAMTRQCVASIRGSRSSVLVKAGREIAGQSRSRRQMGGSA
jgi:hypothetical protein